ncbi:MAG: type II secretion system protein [Candidatus Sericytochromatia bacterium]
MTQRRGFTLLELTLVALILSVIMAAVFNAFTSARRTQAVAVSHALLKAGGQKALKDIYVDLGRSRKLIASTELDAATKDRGREYFTRFQGITAPPAVNFGNMVFPRVDSNGGFGLPGTGSGELEQNKIGNVLVFVANGPSIDLNPPLIMRTLGGVPKALQTTPYTLNTFRFVAYYMAERPLPAGIAPVKISNTQRMNHTLQLMRWESQPYVERSEFETFANNLVLNPVATWGAWEWMQNHANPDYHLAGLWDSSKDTAATAFYTVNGSGVVVAVTNPSVKRAKERAALTINTDPYGLSMVAFNTKADYVFTDNMTVPAYAPTDAAHQNYPYGFEVGIAGPTGARSVLIRLALASRVNAGLHLFGQAQQQIVKVVDM